MNILEIVLLVTGCAGLIAPLTFLYAKLVKPVKKIVSDIEQNKTETAALKKDLQDVEASLKERDIQATENRVITIKSLIAVLEALEKAGHNGNITKTKKELINHIAKRAGGSKK